MKSETSLVPYNHPLSVRPPMAHAKQQERMPVELMRVPQKVFSFNFDVTSYNDNYYISVNSTLALPSIKTLKNLLQKGVNKAEHLISTMLNKGKDYLHHMMEKKTPEVQNRSEHRPSTAFRSDDLESMDKADELLAAIKEMQSRSTHAERTSPENTNAANPLFSQPDMTPNQAALANALFNRSPSLNLNTADILEDKTQEKQHTS